MIIRGWTEARKECEVDENGEIINTRTILEPVKKGLVKKEIIDLIFRTIGLLAIAIPITLFYLQQKAERNKQKALFQLDIHSNTSVELHRLLNKPVNSIEFESSKEKLFYELYPKLTLMNNLTIIRDFEELKAHISLYSLFGIMQDEADSLTVFKDQIPSLVDQFSIPYKAAGSSQNTNVNYQTINDILEELEEFSYARKHKYDIKPFLENNDSTVVRFAQLNLVNRKKLEDFSQAVWKMANGLYDAYNQYEWHSKQQDSVLNEVSSWADTYKSPVRSELYESAKKHNDYLNMRVRQFDSLIIKSNILLYDN